jgi:hypothetical protein
MSHFERRSGGAASVASNSALAATSKATLGSALTRTETNLKRGYAYRRVAAFDRRTRARDITLPQQNGPKFDFEAEVGLLSDEAPGFDPGQAVIEVAGNEDAMSCAVAEQIVDRCEDRRGDRADGALWTVFAARPVMPRCDISLFPAGRPGAPDRISDSKPRRKFRPGGRC